MSSKSMSVAGNEFRERAARIQRQFVGAERAIANDGNLSAVGRRNQLAALTRQRNDALATVRAEEQQARTERKIELERQLFVVSSTQQSEFDGYVRALRAQGLDRGNAAATRQAIEVEMNSAARRGNSLLQRALVEVAIELGATDVAGEYYAAAGWGDSFSEWHAIEHPDPATGWRDRLMEQVLFTPPRPAEVAHLNTRQLAEAADAAGSDGDAA